MSHHVNPQEQVKSGVGVAAPLEPCRRSTKATYTVDEAAAVLNCHPQTIRRAIRNGNLKAAKVGRGLSISRFDLEAYYQAKGGGRLFANDTLDVLGV